MRTTQSKNKYNYWSSLLNIDRDEGDDFVKMFHGLLRINKFHNCKFHVFTNVKIFLKIIVQTFVYFTFFL